MDPPLEVPGVSNMRQGPLNTPFEVWCANIAPKLKNIQNSARKLCFFWHFFFNFDDFWSLCLLGAILAQRENSFICEKKNVIFWHPWDPWGRINSGDTRVLRFVFDFFACQCPLADFFILLKLKPDVTFIDLTWIKVKISLFIATMAGFSKWYKLWVL